MSDNKATEKQRSDSIYARGVCMVKMKPSAMEKGRELTGKVLDLLECLKEAGALNQTAAATAMRRNRQAAGQAANSLWRAGMIDIYNVLSRDVNGFNAQFQLCVAKGGQPPADAGEACRLAILSLFYGHAKIEMPGFGWRLIHRSGRPVLAEVSFDGKDGAALRWLIDTPRQNEDPVPDADIFIYPTHEDALQKTPAGKRYTWDLAVVGARPDEFRYAVKLKK